MDIAAPPAPAPRRRVPLVTGALVLIIVAAAISHFAISRPLLARRRELQEQTDALNDARSQLARQAADRSRLCVIAHDEPNRLQEGGVPSSVTWRVFVPPNTKWRMCWMQENVPQSGIPDAPDGSLVLHPDERGECLVGVSWQRSLARTWSARLTSGSQQRAVQLTRPQSQWLVQKIPLVWICAGAPQLEPFAPDQPTVLLRCQKQFDGSRSVLHSWSDWRSGAAPTPDQLAQLAAFDPHIGILIWLERIADQP